MKNKKTTEIVVTRTFASNSVKLFDLYANYVAKRILVEKGILQEKSRDFEVGALENYECFTLYEKQLSRHFDLTRIGVKAELYKNGILINEKTYLFKPEKELQLTKPEMKLKAELKDGEIAVTVKSDRFARLVRVESSLSTLPLSDNYFDLLPGERVCPEPGSDRVSASEDAGRRGICHRVGHDAGQWLAGVSLHGIRQTGTLCSAGIYV